MQRTRDEQGRHFSFLFFNCMLMIASCVRMCGCLVVLMAQCIHEAGEQTGPVASENLFFFSCLEASNSFSFFHLNGPVTESGQIMHRSARQVDKVEQHSSSDCAFADRRNPQQGGGYGTC